MLAVPARSVQDGRRNSRRLDRERSQVPIFNNDTPGSEGVLPGGMLSIRELLAPDGPRQSYHHSVVRERPLVSHFFHRFFRARM